MWAMIPMFRVLASGWWRVLASAMIDQLSGSSRRSCSLPGLGPQWPVLPAVVGGGLVGFRHLVQVLAAFGGGADAVGRVADLVGQPLRHRLLTALLGVADQPPDGQGGG